MGCGCGGVREASDSHPEGISDELARVWLVRSLRQGHVTAALHASYLLLRRGCSVAALYGDVVQPMLDDMCEGLRGGRLRLADARLCNESVRTLIHRLSVWTVPTGRLRGRVVLASPFDSCDEHCMIEMMMLHHGLAVDGWEVNRPYPIPPREFVAYLDCLGGVDVVFLCLHDAAQQAQIRECVSLIRNAVPRAPVMVHGFASRQDRELWRRVGADAAASDVVSGTRLARQVCNPLTEREVQVLDVASRGRTNSQIALDLGMNMSTVKTHLERIYEKSGLRDRAGSVALALRRGWMS